MIITSKIRMPINKVQYDYSYFKFITDFLKNIWNWRSSLIIILKNLFNGLKLDFSLFFFPSQKYSVVYLANRKFLKESSYNRLKSPIFYLLENETILSEYSRERKHVAIAVTAKVEFDDRPLPKFKVPGDPARGFINISDGVERKEGGV